MSFDGPTGTDPVVLSYKALRRFVGYVAIALPMAVVFPYLLLHAPHVIQGSISAYYYTGLRNLFVGSLCAISMFMIGARGYDRRDEWAGLLSAICALGVAFAPMDPTKIFYKVGCTSPHWYNRIHYVFAVTLFLTLGYFCLRLFPLTSGNPTRQKLQRNVIYKICGWTMYGTMTLELLIVRIAKIHPSMDRVPHRLLCETICLWAFGYAWLIKGEAYFKDVPPQTSTDVTTDSLLPD